MCLPIHLGEPRFKIRVLRFKIRVLRFKIRVLRFKIREPRFKIRVLRFKIDMLCLGVSQIFSRLGNPGYLCLDAFDLSSVGLWHC